MNSLRHALTAVTQEAFPHHVPRFPGWASVQYAVP